MEKMLIRRQGFANADSKESRAAKIVPAGHIRSARPVHYREPEQGEGWRLRPSLPRRGTQGKRERRREAG